MTNEYDEEHDAPKEIPNEITEEVRNMTPSFKMVDVNKYFDLIKYKPYGKQWLYHKSKTRFKIVNAGRRAGKTMMVGKNVQPLLLVPNKRIWGVGPSYCTDSATEILTRRGWLKYNEIIEGDETLTLNNSGLAEWQTIDSVHIFDGQHDMVSMEWRGHSSLTTPNHRWLVGYITRNTNHGGAETLGFRFTTTENLKKANEYVLCAAPVTNLPTEQKYTDAFVELVAWYWTEGCDQAQGNGIIITQNRGPNSNRIAGALTSLFGPASDSHLMRNRYDTKPRWSDWKTIDGLNRCGNFGLNSHAGVLFRDVAPDKVVSSEFISSLTKSQLELFINVSVMADGHSRERDGLRGRERGVVQKRKDRLEQLQMACQLAGYQTNLNYQQSREDYWLAIFERNKIWPGGKTQKAKHKDVKYDGVVWCPKTSNGTWLARRNGTVYFTGNTLGEKEFRVVWDDMIVRLGFGKDKRVKKAYNIKQGNMFIELPWNTRFEVRSAERPDYLVGDSLDHVIMSEAAIHNAETWYRYIQPALSDKRGTADFPSTPRGMNWYHKLWQYGQNPDYLEFESWQYPSWANQIIYPGGRQDPEILLLERTLPHDEFLQEIAADFTSFAGKIYSEFDETIHVRKCTYNPAWRNYIAFDFGYVNPLAAIEFQVDPMDRVHIWREHYKDRIILEDHLDILRNRVQPPGYKIDLCFGDAADPGAIETISSYFAPCWGDPKSKDDWMEGVRLVKSFLKQQEVGVIDEYGTPKLEPWLFVDHSCENTIREFNNYRSAPKVSTRNEANLRESAQKYDDHALDALRYGMVHIFKLGANVSIQSVVGKGDLKKIEDGGFFKNSSLFKTVGGLFDNNKRF